MLEHTPTAAHECANGHGRPGRRIDQCKDFGPYLLVLVVLLLLSTAIEFIFRKLDDLGAALGKEVFGRVKQELAILGTLSFTMFTAVAIFLVRAFQTQTLSNSFAIANFVLLYAWTDGTQLQYQWFNYFLPAIEFVLLLAVHADNLALCFSIGPFADAASVAEAMLPVEGGEEPSVGRVVSLSTAPPPGEAPRSVHRLCQGRAEQRPEYLISRSRPIIHATPLPRHTQTHVYRTSSTRSNVHRVVADRLTGGGALQRLVHEAVEGVHPVLVLGREAAALAQERKAKVLPTISSETTRRAALSRRSGSSSTSCPSCSTTGSSCAPELRRPRRPRRLPCRKRRSRRT